MRARIADNRLDWHGWACLEWGCRRGATNPPLAGISGKRSGARRPGSNGQFGDGCSIRMSVRRSGYPQPDVRRRLALARWPFSFPRSGERSSWRRALARPAWGWDRSRGVRRSGFWRWRSSFPRSCIPSTGPSVRRANSGLSFRAASSERHEVAREAGRAGAMRSAILGRQEPRPCFREIPSARRPDGFRAAAYRRDPGCRSSSLTSSHAARAARWRPETAGGSACSAPACQP